jgi:hypothetical protein
MKKDSFWNQLISSIAGLGIPGLVLLVVMSSTGFVGAAALTTALASLGGPLGMLGGIAVLGVLSMMAKGLSAYGLDAIFNAVVDELKKRGLSKDDIKKELGKLPIPGSIKDQVEKGLDSNDTSTKSPTGSLAGRRVFLAKTLDLEVNTIVELRDLHSASSEMIRIASKVAEGVWEGVIEDGASHEIVKVLFQESTFREFISPTRSLTIGEIYRLPERQTTKESRVKVEVVIDDGYWLGACVDPGGDEEIVYVVYQNR